MHTGKIKKIVPDRGFGFIDDTDGREVFFHQSVLEGVEISALRSGQEVEFEIEKTNKGPRAINMRLIQQP